MRRIFKGVFWLSISFLFVLLYLFTLFIIGVFLDSIFGHKAGAYGDMFGGVNTAFSGLAFCALIVALFLQGVEMRKSEERRKEEMRVVWKQFSLHAIPMLLKMEIDHLKTHYNDSEFLDFDIETSGIKAIRDAIKCAQRDLNENDIKTVNFLFRMNRVLMLRSRLDDMYESLPEMNG